MRLLEPSRGLLQRAELAFGLFADGAFASFEIEPGAVDDFAFPAYLLQSLVQTKLGGLSCLPVDGCAFGGFGAHLAFAAGFFDRSLLGLTSERCRVLLLLEHAFENVAFVPELLLAPALLAAEVLQKRLLAFGQCRTLSLEGLELLRGVRLRFA
ncbi:MAG: hypothetical protein ACREI7_00760 [Myxococcota bacterium]